MCIRVCARPHARMHIDMRAARAQVGEAEFIRQAKLCKLYGCAVVVMAFDEAGQAATEAEKVGR